MIGVVTIGNATIIGYADKPIISTDPWLGDEDPALDNSKNMFLKLITKNKNSNFYKIAKKIYVSLK